MIPPWRGNAHFHSRLSELERADRDGGPDVQHVVEITVSADVTTGIITRRALDRRMRYTFFRPERSLDGPTFSVNKHSP